ncbi:MAG: bifunctional [glutamine synthetase] adenylyltransferase/[glutamine synthetase]-adenylyl-L-tyrosine phosphorylase [Hyphomicrobiales bacterium]|nr:bifunctional [glutamine synthetase] adenylyltransferase/[glutamine synthetase]-adenylyl-L-tyrosine phosphorylase [Hyphomicrobiales bacterium]MBV8824373.1 bifunctional [glutamine synthetase] adenylyltransferase/[glutamine synthetase]-adenylyl-L-tyrosine phosphorylase [Hyphomicrobiales bacterium]MBV9426134.1 bifunctional [glutamine synthetase] adenylyltransferase/[glutamine synthetase]-adenylyl-L-tyrosine phosphorylase [Bradyrhizobiaceae bacterium]
MHPMSKRAAKQQSAAPERDKLADWLSEIRETDGGAALDALFAREPSQRALIERLAAHSPFLWQLASEDPARLLALLSADPDAHLSQLIERTTAAAAATADDAEVTRLLRRMKSEAALLIALADIGGRWPVMRVTRALTELADAAVTIALRHLLRAASRTKRITLPNPARPEDGCGLAVIAMGKMGAFELNYSSDIDLILVFDPAATLAADIEPALFYIRIARGLVKFLQERTADGYVFRVDLRLRPDPGSTQIAISTVAALAYYESIGQNWERAALIKARVAAGDRAVGEALLKELVPFIWRKYLDYAAIADVHAMKRQMHAYRGHDEIAVEGHNIKLGRGGIREIEFFVQTQQLIAGGRHPELRGRETLAMLSTLAAGGWIGTEAARDLADAYCFLRQVEHRLQMIADEQTHVLPADAAALDRFARFLGFPGRDQFAAALLGHMRKVQGHYARLFEDAGKGERLRLEFPADGDDSHTLDTLVGLGFRNPLEVSAMVRRWFAEDVPALRGEIAKGHFAELVPLLIEHVAHGENPDRTIVAFDRFLAAVQGGGRLFSLLLRNPDLVALLTLALGTAPRLADIVARHPQVMDALIDPAFFAALPDAAKLADEFARSSAQARSYEDFLDRTRSFGQEHMFLIGARILSGTVSAEQAGAAYARLADVLISAVHREVEQSFAAAHGRLPAQQSAVLALGKLGGRETTAGSDLDLILVYDFAGEHPASDGPRPLTGFQYFARFTQRLISALTAQTNYGSLYHVDMRLRPTGRSGPVATQIDGFRAYHAEDAWTWEHMALTRARVVSASPGFAARVDEVVRDTLTRRRDPATVAADVLEMRRAIAQEKGEGERWDLKYTAGGLVDLEFIAQYLQLVHAAERPDILDTSTARVLDKAWAAGVLAPEDADVLRPAARLYHNLTQVLRLCLSGPFDPKSAGSELLRLLARAADLPDFATLEPHLADTQTKVRASFNRIIGG